MTHDVAGRDAATLDLDGAADRAGLMECCADTLALPDRSGRNWDALVDCLGDSTVWAVPAVEKGLLVVVTGWQPYAQARPTSGRLHGTCSPRRWTASAPPWRWRSEDDPVAHLGGQPVRAARHGMVAGRPEQGPVAALGVVPRPWLFGPQTANVTEMAGHDGAGGLLVAGEERVEDFEVLFR